MNEFTFNVLFVFLLVGVVASTILLTEMFADQKLSRKALAKKLRNWRNEGFTTKAFVLVFVPTYAIGILVPLAYILFVAH